jgi:hypothetical protein
MPFYIRDNEATATRRRVPLYIYADTAGTAWAGSVTGVKARLSVNGAAEADTVADIVRVAGSYHYAQLSQAEVNVAPGDIIHVRVPAASGRLEAFAVCEIGADDIFAAQPTLSDITSGSATAVDAVLADNFAAIPGAVRTTLATELGRIDVAVSTGVGPNAAAVSSQVMTDLAGAGGAAARTAIGVAVDGALADNFNAIPDIADIIAALRTENTSSAWGVSSTPGGGSSIIYTDRRGGTTLGTRTAFFDSTGKMVGLSAVA